MNRAFRIQATAALLAIVVASTASAGQNSIGFRYFYDDAGRVTTVIDTDGTRIDYVYDAAGNRLRVDRSAVPTSGTVAIFAFAPQAAPAGATVTIQGQAFALSPPANVVAFNGVQATVVSATATTLTATVPASATTGRISVKVAGQTATSRDDFTVIAVPRILSVNPRFVVSRTGAIDIPHFSVTGAELGGSTFVFAPAFVPPRVGIASATIAPTGESATLSLNIAPATSGSFTLVATNAAGGSSQLAGPHNTLNIIAPDDDADGDGLTNAAEVAIGSDPLNADSDGDGLPDGWELFYGLNPLDGFDAAQDADNDGFTSLQEFQGRTSPRDPNRIPPIVSQVSPRNGATDVFVNTAVVVRMAGPLMTGVSLGAAQTAIGSALGPASTVPAASRAIAAQTLQSYLNRTCCGNSVIPGTVSLLGPNGPVGGSVAGSNDGLSVTFAPSQPLPANTTYSVQVRGLRDAAGNLMAQAFRSSFTTGATLDSTAPRILLTVPSQGTVDVPTNVHYTVQFNKAIDPGSVTPNSFSIVDYTTGLPVSGMIQVDPSGLTAAFVPDPALPIGRTFHTDFSTAIKDVAGNNLPSLQSFSFSTGYGPDTDAPHLVANSPVDGQNDVPVNALIDLAFNEPLNMTTLPANVQVSLGGQSIPVLFALSTGNRRVTITPAQGLTPNGVYTVTVGAGVADLGGFTLDNPASFSFQTVPVVDKTAPRVAALDPAPGSQQVPTNASIRMLFSERINPVTTTTANVLVYPSAVGLAVVVPGTVNASADGLTVTFTPSAPLQADTSYGIYLTNITDLVGQGLSGGFGTYATFTTGAGPQTTAPTVAVVTPPDGATGVPINAMIQAKLTAPVSAATVRSSAITVTPGGGSAVAGTVSVESGNTVVRFTPAAPLQPSTIYTLQIGGFTDFAGTPVVATTSTFTTGTSAVADTTRPSAVATPANGATNVAVTTPVVVTFSEPINPLTAANILVRDQSNNYYTLAGTWSVSGAVATFTAATPYPGNAVIQVWTQNAVQDLAGNPDTAYVVTTFTTAATADAAAPTVVAVTPADGATGIGPNGQVVITFSESMNPATLVACCPGGFYGNVALYANGTRLSFSPSVSADNRTLTLTASGLPAATTVAVIVTHGATDLSGNALVDFASTFETAAAFDTGHAVVTSQRPGTGATGVPVTSPVALFVSEPLRAASVAGAVHVSQNGQLVAGTVTLTGGGQVIAFTPSAPWTYGALVQVFLDPTAVDVNGTTVTAYQGSFTVAGDPATAAPTAVAATPANGATGVPRNTRIRIGYSGTLDLTTASFATQTVWLAGNNQNPVPATLTLDGTGTVLQIVPTTALAASTQYCYYINYFNNGLRGSAGQPVSGYVAACFTTGTSVVTTAPTVTVVSPADGLTNVPVNAQVRVVFSAPIDPLTVTGATIQLSGGGDTAAPLAISFSNGNQTVQMTPQGVLPPNTPMTLTVTGVQDGAGNAVPAFTSHFTTSGTAAVVTPSVVSTTPTNGASGVPVNTAIVVRTNAVIDPTTLVGHTVSVYDNATNEFVAGTLSASADGPTVYFVPATPLAVNRTYMLGVNYFQGYVTDVVGNAVGGYAITFATGLTASTTAPAVTAVSPADGVTQVPTNARVTVQFDEPVNGQTLDQVTLAGSNGPVAVSRTLSNGNQTLTLTPLVVLRASTLYTVTVAEVRDLSGQAMTAPVTSAFTTGAGADFTPTAVAVIDPANGTTAVPTNAQIRVRFTKQVAVTSANVLVYPSAVGLAVVVPGSVGVSADGLTVTFTPSAPLQAETSYGVYLTNITDLVGQGLSGGYGTYTTFTTGAGAQTTAPTVAAVTPPDGATGVPVNAVIQVQLSAPVSAATATATAIALTRNGGSAVPGTVTLESGNRVLRFAPATALSASTVYTLQVNGVTDLAGTAVAPFTSTFTTGTSAVADTTRPSAVATPANGATNVAVTTPVVVTFSEPINPLTAANILVRDQSNNYYTLAGTWSVSGAVATFTAATPYPGNAVIQVWTQNAVQDLAGNPDTAYVVTTFTTAATADAAAPTVVAVTPADGATGIGPNGQVVITFSESMNPATLVACCPGGFYGNVALYANGTRLSFSPSVSADNRTLTLTASGLPAATTVAVIVTHGVTDLSGNALVDFASTFETAAAFDTTHATVTNQRPGTGATGVPVTSPAVLFVSEPLRVASVGGAVHVSQNGQLVAGTVTLTGGGQVIAFTPSAPWMYGALVQVFLDSTAVDVNGTPVTAYQGTFTIARDPATGTLTAVAATPASGASGVPRNTRIRIGYSGTLDLTTASFATQTVWLTGNNQNPVPATLTLDGTGTVLQIVPTTALAASTQYCYYINYFNNGLRGSAGQPVSGYVAACFTTGAGEQTTAPTVTVVSPADGLTNVPVNAQVRVGFSAPIDPLTVTGATIQLSGGGETAAPLAISFSNGNQTVQMTPQGVLPPDTPMTLTVTGVQDGAGNAVPAFTSHFTTSGTAAAVTPSVVSTTPTNGASGVPVNAAIVVRTNAVIDPTTLTGHTVAVYDNTTNQFVAAMLSLSTDGTTVYVVPATPLGVNRTYTLGVDYFQGYVTDVVGTAVGGYAITFTTGLTASTTAPAVTAVSPADGVTQVATNAHVTVQFDEPVDGQSLNQVTLAGSGPVAVSRTLSNGNQTLTLTPLVVLRASTLYTLTVTGVRDLSEQAMTAPVTSTFTTGAGVDFTPPAVVVIDPANGTAAVPTNAQIRVRFTKQVAVTSANVLVYPTVVGLAVIVPGQVSVSADGLTVTFTPSAPLQAETSYGVYLTNITDLVGQGLSGGYGTYTTFTTGAGAQTTAPTVAAVTPPDGTTGVPVNAVIQVQLSAPVSAATATATAITLTRNGGSAVPGTVTLEGGNRVLRFAPAPALSASTVYTLQVNGVTDLAGTAVAPFTSTFTTGTSAAADTTRPSAVATPANGATNVAVTTPVVVTFSEPINPLTAGNILVRDQSNNYYNLAGTWNVTGAVATFTPTTPYPGNAVIQVWTQNAVQDLAGNSDTAYVVTTFTTAATPDAAAPTVVAVTPADGATGIGPNAQVMITFSESVNPATVTTCCGSGNYDHVSLYANGTRLSFSPSMSADNRTVTLMASGLPAATTVAVIVTRGVTDLSGNALADFASTFETAAAFDTGHAVVTSQRPGTGATGVPVTSPAVLFVSEPLRAASVAGAVHVSQNGQLVAGTVTLTGGGQVIAFTPSAPWTYGALVQVFLDPTAMDVNGTTVTAYQGSFTVAGDPATAALTAVAATPANGASGVPRNTRIRIGYSGTLDLTTASFATQTVWLAGNNQNPVPATLTLDGTGTVLQIAPTTALAANTQYCYYINYFNNSLRGSAGQPVSGYVAACFTTGAGEQTTAPTVTVVSPADGLTNVPVNAQVRVMFSAPIDPLTVTGATIQLSGGGETAAPLAISFSNGNQTVQMTPQGVLPPDTPMTLTVTGVQDGAGNAVPAFTSHFTTSGTAAAVTPSVVSTTPTNGASGVPVNAAIVVRTNAVIDPTTLTGHTVAVYDNTTNQFVAATLSLSTDGTTVYVVPATPLGVNRTYTLGVDYFQGYVTDVVGTAVGGYAITFTTGLTASTTAPAVTAVSPADGVTQVATNAHVTVQFDEPVDGQSLNQVTLAGSGPVAVSRTLSNGNQTLTLTPLVVLRASTLYTLTVTGVRDLSEQAMTAPVTSTFTTAAGVDFTRPSVALVDPPSGTTGVGTNAQVRVRFTKQVAVTSANVLLYPTVVGLAVIVPGQVSVSADGLTATFTPSAPLQAETVYGVYLTNITDLVGQGLSGGFGTYATFTTGAGPQTTAPTVAVVTPPDGATGVPINAMIQAKLTAPVSAATVRSSAITVTPGGGSAVAGTVSVESGNMVVRFTPAAPLQPSTIYTLQIGGFTDFAGTPVVATTSTFTTGTSAVADTTRPSAVATPANGATNVAVTTPVVVTFSEPINPLTAANILVRDQSNNYYTLAGTWSVSGAVATFTAATPYPGNAVIQVWTQNAVQDLAGNPDTAYVVTTFTTAATADAAAPTVVAVTPADGATGIGPNGQVVITFSESMNPATLVACCPGGFYGNVALYANGTRLSLSPSVSADNRTVTLTPSGLPPATTVAVIVTHGVTDLSGNALVDFASAFETAAAFDTTHATVTSQRPGTGATGVPVTSPVVLFVSEPLRAASVAGAVHVSQNGQLVAGTVTLTGGGQVIAFTPSAPWMYGALVQVFLDSTAVDVNGTTVTAYQGSFTVAGDPATAASTAVAATPANGATGVPRNTRIRIGYSGTLDLTTASFATQTVWLAGNNQNPVPATLTLDGTGTVLQIVPTTALAASTQYCYYINYFNNGLRGSAGQPVSGYVAACFTTGTSVVTTAPTLTAVSPADGLTNVPVNAQVRVVFSAPIDPLTVTGATIQLSGGGETAAPLAISFSNGNQTVQMTPQGVLPPNTPMTLTVTGLQDGAGNPVPAFTSDFTTSGVAATVTPLILSTNPPPGASNVPTNAVVAVQTNAVLDLASVTEDTFRVRDEVTGQNTAGTYSVSSDGMTLYFLASAPLATGRTYTVFVNSSTVGLTDVAGNLLHWCCGYTFAFTTGIGPSATAPQVSAVSPANGTTQVPTNGRVMIQFSEPVDVQTLGQITVSAAASGPIPVFRTMTNANQTLFLTPLAALRPNTTYTVNIAGVADLSGVNVIAPVTTTFVTGATLDFSQPQVSAVVPNDGAAGVGTNTTVQVQFNKSINAQTITSSTFNVTVNGGTLIAGTIVVATDGRTATFTPTSNLLPTTTYVVRLNAAVTDLAGLAAASFQSTFTTGSQ